MAETSNDDRTVVRGASPAAQAPHNTLPIGTRLGEFEIVGLVGEGGFGIVYLAEDHSLGRKVALKEYMPSSLAARGTDASVVVRSERHQETFEIGLKSFVNEARLLAQFDHPALVKVYRFWEANSTAYMAMPYYKGKTLREVLKERPAAPDESWIKKILMPVMEALEIIHQDHCYHRDIAPDNIMLLADERPVLLDFGAARRVISDMTQALTVILKPGYAPIEQYAEMPGMKQGPWTDVYALAAVVYFMIQRRTPPPAVGRMMQDSYEPLARIAAGRYSDTFLRGIDACLAVKAEDRPQSIAQMREVLGLALESPLFAPAAAISRGATQSPPTSAESATARTRILDSGQTAAGVPDRASTPTAANKRNTAIIATAATLAGLAVLGGVGWYFASARPKSADVVETQPSSSSPADVAVAPPAKVESPAPAPQETTPPAPAKPPAPPSYASLDDALEAVKLGSDAGMDVRLSAPASLPLGSILRLSVTSKTPGYLYLFLWDKAGDKFYRLFPNTADTDNSMKANMTFSMPRTRLATPWTFPTGNIKGEWQVLALLSERVRDFGNSALGEDGNYLASPRQQIETRLGAHAGLSALLGDPKCEAAPCTERYAVRVATIAKVAPAPEPVAPEPAKPPGTQVRKTPTQAPPVAAAPAEKPAKRSQTSSGDTSADAEREYMKQLNKDLDKLLGK